MPVSDVLFRRFGGLRRGVDYEYSLAAGLPFLNDRDLRLQASVSRRSFWAAAQFVTGFINVPSDSCSAVGEASSLDDDVDVDSCPERLSEYQEDRYELEDRYEFCVGCGAPSFRRYCSDCWYMVLDASWPKAVTFCRSVLESGLSRLGSGRVRWHACVAACLGSC